MIDRDDSEVLLQFGELEDGTLVHVSTVASGAACGCRCPNCGRDLIAKRGEKRAHHFAHAADPGSECTLQIAVESGLHRFAKQVIALRRLLTIPAVIATHGEQSEEVAPAKELQADTVRLECILGNVRPDIIVSAEGQEFVVEIAVTHFADQPKRADLRSIGLPSVEIDLSAARDVPVEELEARILHVAPRHWLYNAEQAAAEARLRAAAEKSKEARHSPEPERPEIMPRLDGVDRLVLESWALVRKEATEALGGEEAALWLDATIKHFRRTYSNPLDEIDCAVARAMLVNEVLTRQYRARAN